MDQMTYRAVKGSALTNDELDTNFRLCFEKDGGVGLDGSFDVDPATGGFSLGLTDGEKVGPIVVPAQPAASRGDWVSGRVYEPAEFFSFEGGLWQTVLRHQAATVTADRAAGRIRLVYAGGGGLALPVKDGKSYVVKDQAYAEIVLPTIPALPAKDGKLYGIRDEVWTEVPAATGDGSGKPAAQEFWRAFPPKVADNGEVVAVFVAMAECTFRGVQRIIRNLNPAETAGVVDYKFMFSNGSQVLQSFRYDPAIGGSPFSVEDLVQAPLLPGQFVRLVVSSPTLASMKTGSFAFVALFD